MATTTKRPNITLTDKQYAVLKVIDEGCRADNLGRSPTLQKIAVAVECAKSTVYGHVEALKEKGMLSGEAWVQRSMAVTDEGREALRKAKR